MAGRGAVAHCTLDVEQQEDQVFNLIIIDTNRLETSIITGFPAPSSREARANQSVERGTIDPRPDQARASS